MTNCPNTHRALFALPIPLRAARQRSQPGWEFRGIAAWRALWHRSSSDPSLSPALAPSCCSPRQGDVTGDTSRCWCQALFPKITSTISPAAPAAPTSITCTSSGCQEASSRRIPEKITDTQPSLFVKSPSVTELLWYWSAAANVASTPPLGGKGRIFTVPFCGAA